MKFFVDTKTGRLFSSVLDMRNVSSVSQSHRYCLMSCSLVMTAW
ncbi:MAG: hypothetical protein PHR69_00260 [Sphaerochaeta sp.]|nr:hypothetical protein [Sphaerochaeta sp.]